MPPGTAGPDLHKNYTIFFNATKDGGCIARREKKGRRIVRVGPKYSETCYVVSMRIFFNMMKYINPEQISIEIGLVRSEVRYLMEDFPSEVSLKCDRLTVTAYPLAFLTSLIARVTPGCKLRIYDSRPGPFVESGAACIASDVFDFETMKMAPSIDTNVLCEVSDKQFVCLRAHTVFMIAPRLTSKGINGIIAQWTDGKRKIARIHLTAMEGLDKKMVFENVDSANILSESEIQTSPSLKEYAESCFEAGIAGVVGIRNKSRVVLLNISPEVCELVDPHSNED
ncbi:unnamed protein product [Cylicocyclus nassatus]|uniref:Uncharacterized protein n=1 Tax=Cylicocyclus nassatus TaxID=53992 RepID=A0AA36GG41_CYLNA|nr:unnamed protein product [Cylicocyclus nassatus]